MKFGFVLLALFYDMIVISFIQIQCEPFETHTPNKTSKTSPVHAKVYTMHPLEITADR